MLHKIFNAKNIEKSANYALFAGVFFTLVSFITSSYLFRNVPSLIGVSTVIFTVTMTLPILLTFFDDIALYDKKKSFAVKTKKLLDFYIYFFIGSFVTFFLVSLVMPSKVLSSEQIYGTTKIIVPKTAGLPPPPIDANQLLFGIFKNNFSVMIAAFVLSLIFGAGSLFLLTLNASIFASTLSSILWQTMQNTDYVYLYSLISCNMGILFFHMLPEVIAYFLSAIAGALLYVSITKESLFSEEFKKTMKKSLLVLLIAIGVLLISALIEVKLSRNLIASGVCLKNTSYVLIATVLIFIGLIIFEMKRKKTSS